MTQPFQNRLKIMVVPSLPPTEAVDSSNKEQSSEVTHVSALYICIFVFGKLMDKT